MEGLEFHIEIPTWNNGKWSVTTYNSRREFFEFVKSLFKEPGHYDFDETSLQFNKVARTFKENGNVYSIASYGSIDFINYWNGEKAKCRNGVIYKHNGKTWYLPREYYMWLNFLPIYDKIKKKFDFPLVWDIQYHVALYELLAELDYKHVAICKKRQCAMSYYHCAKLINQLWFEKGAELKIGASLIDYVDADFKYMMEYRNFLNEHTAWYRAMSPDTKREWKQQIEVTSGGIKTMKGLKSHIIGLTFDKNATRSVGGPCHRLGTKILMANGRFKNVEDIHVGEYVMGIDSKPKFVQRTFSGIDDMYHIKPRRGNDFYATGDHLLSLFTTDAKVMGDKERLVKVKDWSSLETYKHDRWVLKRNDKPIEYDFTTDCTLDPYFLGLWLGDGFRDKNGLIINVTRDKEILDYCIELSNRINVPFTYKRKEENRYNDYMVNAYFPISVDREDTDITKDFVKYNLYYNKHIPDEYLYGSVEVRKQVLAGIIDTDGHFLTKQYRYEVSQKDDVLFNQIVFLARSLGAIVHVRKSASQEHIVNGRVVKYSETNVCAISFKDQGFLPVRLPRKQTTHIKDKSIFYSIIDSVTNIGKEQYAGIQVEDEHYFINDLLITHNCVYMYHEEAGIAPEMDKVLEFILPALKMGDITTGLFIASGSVGELTDAEPLKNMLLNPVENDVYPVETTLMDENGLKGLTGLFLPEQWGMPPYIDNYGNSQVEDALNALNKQFAEWKNSLSPQQYQLRISQHPRNIKECFASRTVSIFPMDLIEDQTRRIEDKEYPYELVDLDEDVYKNEIIVRNSVKAPISKWPIPMNTQDKEGSIVVWERPDKDIKPGTYIASVDPVSAAGTTTTSDSLCSIYVYKMPVSVKRFSGDEVESFIEGDKIVCAWCGRFDDINDTHKRLRLIIEWYRAETIVENNVPQFITYMIHQRKQQYLVPENRILFLKEIAPTRSNVVKYGWRNTGNFFKKNMLPYLIDYLKEVIFEETNDVGMVTKKVFGISRIPDKMAMVEMRGYNDKVNVDRIISLGALIAYVQIKLSNTTMSERVENEIKEEPQKYNINISPFSMIGTKRHSDNFMIKQPFTRIGRKRLW